MKTYFIVKAPSKRYHIYNALGVCVSIVASKFAAFNYLDEVLATSSCTDYIFRYTAAAGTFIVTMK